MRVSQRIGLVGLDHCRGRAGLADPRVRPEGIPATIVDDQNHQDVEFARSHGSSISATA